MNITQATQAKNSSQSFLLAAERSFEQRSLSNGQFQMLIVPAVVCLAFSIELGIKALLLQTGQSIRGHNLKNLFSALSPEQQNILWPAVSSSRVSFDTSLSESAKIFEDWRYIYEQSSASADSEFLTKLANAVQKELSK